MSAEMSVFRLIVNFRVKGGGVGEASFTRMKFVEKYDVFTAFRIHVAVLWSTRKLR